LCYWMKELGLPVSVQFAPYDQVFQQLLAPGTVLTGNESGLNVVLVRLQDWLLPAREERSATIDETNLQSNVDQFISALQAAVARHSTPYLVCFCPPSKAMARESAISKRLARAEEECRMKLATLSGVYTLHADELTRYYPVREYDDPSSDRLGHVPYTSAFFTALGTMIARKFHAL